jgi:type IV secretory pathway VirB2 component (pilin)
LFLFFWLPKNDPNDLFSVFDNVVEVFMGVIIPLVAVVLIIYGASCFILAAESQDRIKKGKDIIKATVIGLLIVYGAKFIIESVISILTGI